MSDNDMRDAALVIGGYAFNGKAIPEGVKILTSVWQHLHAYECRTNGDPRHPDVAAYCLIGRRIASFAPWNAEKVWAL